MRELHDIRGARRIGMSQGSRLRRRGCAAVLTSREVTVAITIHDKMSKLWQKGVGNGPLRDGVRARSGMICCRHNIRAPRKVGANKFEF